MKFEPNKKKGKKKESVVVFFVGKVEVEEEVVKKFNIYANHDHTKLHLGRVERARALCSNLSNSVYTLLPSLA